MIEKFYATGNKVYCGAEIVQDGLSPNRAEKLAKQLNEIHNEDNKKTSIDDIIGIVKTDEPTNSVEEVRKLRGRTGMTEKRFNIKPSAIVDDVTVIIDNQKEYTFPVLDSTLNYMFCKVLNEQNKTIEQLKSELQGMEELLKSYRETIKHDAGLLADATKKGYLPPLEDWK